MFGFNLHLNRLKQNHFICGGTASPFGYAKAWYYSRLKLRIPSLVPASINVHAKTGGRIVKLPVRTNTDDAAVIWGVFGDREYDTELLPVNLNTIIDLGANCGFALAYLHSRFPCATFACIEPDPRNLVQLKRTIEYNKIPATVFAAGVGAVSGWFRLSTNSDLPSCNQINLSSEDGMFVHVLTVEQIMAQMEWDSVDLIKMDIEGMEQQLVMEAGEMLQKAKYIMFEMHSWVDVDGIQNRLDELGFHVKQVNLHGEQVFLAINNHMELPTFVAG